MRRAYGLGDYELARDEALWMGYYLEAPSATGGSFARIRYVQDCRMGSPRIEAMRYSDVAVDDSSAVFCLVRIYERMVKVRGVVSKNALREEYGNRKEGGSQRRQSEQSIREEIRQAVVLPRARARVGRKEETWGNWSIVLAPPARWRF